jgi:hypothetical protein
MILTIDHSFAFCYNVKEKCALRIVNSIGSEIHIIQTTVYNIVPWVFFFGKYAWMELQANGIANISNQQFGRSWPIQCKTRLMYKK